MRIVERLKMWFKHRSNPCYIGNGEFDHDLVCIDASFDHEFGTETVFYMECKICGYTSEEDPAIGDPIDYYGDPDYD